MIQCFCFVCFFFNSRSTCMIENKQAWCFSSFKAHWAFGLIHYRNLEAKVWPDFWDASITSYQSIYIPNSPFTIMCKFIYFFPGHRCKVLKHPHSKWHIIPLLIWYMIGTKIITVSSSLSPSPQLSKESGLGWFHVSPFIALKGEIGICQSALARHL